MTTAAYGATMQLFTYIQMPAMAIGGAVSAMAAQYIGARKWDGLAHRDARGAVLLNVAFTGVMTVLLLLFDRPVLVLFLGPDSPAVEIARHIQFLASWNFVIFGVTHDLHRHHARGRRGVGATADHGTGGVAGRGLAFIMPPMIGWARMPCGFPTRSRPCRPHPGLAVLLSLELARRTARRPYEAEEASIPMDARTGG